MVEESVSPLATIAYGPRAGDLARYIEDPADEAIAEVVHVARTLPDDRREALRTLFDQDDCYTLLTFARRRSASGLRNGALVHALDAIHALCLVTRSKIDFRDLSVDFPLYTVRTLGGDLRSTMAEAAATSEPGTRAAFTAKESRAASLTLGDCALMEVRSAYGIGFMDTSAEAYVPRVDLAGIAIRMADSIDRGGRYEVSDIGVSSLPGTWFGYRGREMVKVPVHGCVSIHAHLPGSSMFGNSLLTFLAEVDDPPGASRMVAKAEAASTRDRPRSAGSRDAVLLLIVGGSMTLGEEAAETEASLRQLRDAMLREVRKPD